MGKCKKIILLLVCCCCLGTSAMPADDMVETCCGLGSSLFVESSHGCSSYSSSYLVSLAQTGLADDELVTCQAIANICCTNMRRTRKCVEGKREMLTIGSCQRLSNPGQESNDDVKECCNCCHLGLMQRIKDKSSCFFPVQLTPGWLCVESFVDCCSKDSQIILKNLLVFQNISAATTQDGSHSHSSSYPGGSPSVKFESDVLDKNRAVDGNFQSNPPHPHEEMPIQVDPHRGEEKHGRVLSHGDPVDRDYSSTHMGLAGKPTTIINFSNSHNCPGGYAWNTITERCEDIDECVVGFHDCETADMCFNKDGGFDCRDYDEFIGDEDYDDSYDGDVDETEYNSEDESSEVIHQTSTPTTTTTTLPTTPTTTTDDPRRGVDLSGGHDWSNVWHNRQPGVQVDRESTSSPDDVFEKFPAPTTPTPPNWFSVSPMTPPIIKVTRYEPPHHHKYHFVTSDQRYKKDDINQHGHNSVIKPNYAAAPSPATPTCAKGYQYSILLRQCIDINECERTPQICQLNETCENTFGSFKCVPRHLSCPPGYTPDEYSMKCIDIDECEQDLHNCPVIADCLNVQGTYRCVRKQCHPGYKLAVNNGNCEPIQCSQGLRYDTNREECVDIDECDIWRSQICLPSQKCINTVGSYVCQYAVTCSNGFEIDHSTGQCKDIDECVLYGSSACASTADCKNTQGSYMCVCRNGFQSDPKNSLSCLDVDECSQPWICHQNCHNSWGSYECSCNIGYKLAADNRTCHDVDECTVTHPSGPPCYGYCQNTEGSYYCYCPTGYSESYDKKSCRDVNECKQNPNICGDTNQVCINTVGGYKCQVVSCPYRFQRIHDVGFRSENNIRCQKLRSPCSAKDLPCMQAPLSYSVHFIALHAKLLKIPANLFTMRGPESTNKLLSFNLQVVSSRDQTNGRENVISKEHFHLRQVRSNEAIIQLIQKIENPVDIHLQLDMNVHMRNSFQSGTAIAQIYVYITKDPWESKDDRWHA